MKIIFNFFAIAILLSLTFVACSKDDDDVEISASFSYSPSSDLYVGDEITFTNLSENASNYLWIFGDDSTSTEENLVHSYSKAGTYTVTLVSQNKALTDYNGDGLIDQDDALDNSDTACMTLTIGQENYFSIGSSEESTIDQVNVLSYGHYYTDSTYNYILMFLTDNLTYAETSGYSGEGNYLYFDIISTNENELSGEYEMSQNGSWVAGVFLTGHASIGYISGTTSGTSYEVASGSVNIEKSDSIYTVSFECISEEGDTISGSYVGTADEFDYTAYSSYSVSDKKMLKSKLVE